MASGFIGIGLGVICCMILNFIVDLTKKEFTPFLWYLISLLISVLFISIGFLL